MTPTDALTILGSLAHPLAPRLKGVGGSNMKVKDGGGTIRIGSKLIASLTGESELAFMLGHELGHIALGHAGTWAYRLGFRRPDLEQAADGYSLRLMRARGYNVKDVPWLFARLMARSSGKARRELTVRRVAIIDEIEGETT